MLKLASHTLREKYQNEDWFSGIGIPNDGEKIILYIKYQPLGVSFPASWDSVPLHIKITTNKLPTYAE